MSFLDWIKAFLLIYVISILTMYIASSKFSSPIVIPGDIFSRKGTRTFYIPLASSLVLAIILFIIFRKIATSL